MFSFSKDGLSVSYDGKMVNSILVGVEPVLTVADQGYFNVIISKSNGLDDTRVDTITNEIKMYINERLHTFDFGDDVQLTGNKICEIYYSMIK